MRDGKHLLAISVAAAGLMAGAARANVTVQLVDVGTPKIPASVDPSGVMTGYTGYLLRLVSDQGTISAVDFGVADTGTIYGAFAQRWTSSNGDALSGGTGYDTPTGGLFTANNSTVTTLNADAHFTVDPLHVTANGFQENAGFFGSQNVNPLRGANSDLVGYGTGNMLQGVIGIIGDYQTSIMDVAYLVVPTGSPIWFSGAQVATRNATQSAIISYGTIATTSSHYSSGSWGDATKWTAGVIPDAAGARAIVGGTITLDGNRSMWRLEGGTNTTIVPGTGGSLIFDNGIGNAQLYAGYGMLIAAPVVLKSNLEVWTGSLAMEISGAISSAGTNTNQSLSLGSGTITLSGNNSYAGTTLLAAGTTIQIGNGGTTGSFGLGDVYMGNDPTNPSTLIFNRSDSYTVSDLINGFGNLVKKGSGTLTLSGNNSFTGTTTIQAGQIVYDGTIGGVSLTPDSDFTNNTPKVVKLVPAAGAYAYIHASENGGLGTQTSFRGGTASSAVSVALQFRTRKAEEQSLLISDVVRITGMASGGSSRTDVFALELSFDDGMFSSLAAERAAAANGQIYLGWLNPNAGDGESPTWQKSVDGNYSQGTDVLLDYQGSWASFAAANKVTDSNIGKFLGSWGVDVAGNTVWAVINHNSDYAATTTAVPEAGTLGILVAGTVGLLIRKRTRAQD